MSLLNRNAKYKKPPAKGGYSFARAFLRALAGLWHALLHERNLRIDVAAAAYVFYFAHYFDLARAEYAVLCVVVGFVIVCELINTAIENVVDLCTTQRHPLAKAAKDIAAGAALLSALTSVVVGVFLFWDPPVFSRILSDIRAHPVIWVAVLLLTGAFIGFVHRDKNRVE